ncbi:phenylalanine--tRNA ligase alpha subunit [Pycnococcus provasolii]
MFALKGSITPIRPSMSPCGLGLHRGSQMVLGGGGGARINSHRCCRAIHVSSSTDVVSAASAASSSVALTRSDVIKAHPRNNVSDYIFNKVGVNLHHRREHPLGILRTAIQEYFETKVATDGKPFAFFDDMAPVVRIEQNFDELLIPKDHVSRSSNDTYYVDDDTVLRCHTSAHQLEKLKAGNERFLVMGDVYRRDTIDATHYPVFHQMEGVRVFDPSEWEAAGMDSTAFAEQELKNTLEGLARHLFGDVEMRWVDAYFPFTEPSAELEVFYGGDWLEVLGCGVMRQEILTEGGSPEKRAWAFGLGLERLAMVLFEIPDIRLFWSEDERFLKQWKGANESNWRDLRFKSFSKYPAVFKDMAFWLPEDADYGGESNSIENNLCELIKDVGGDLVEEVKLIDEFTNPKTGKTSNCYRISYRSMERSLTNEEINALQDTTRDRVVEELKVELR